MRVQPSATGWPLYCTWSGIHSDSKGATVLSRYGNVRSTSRDHTLRPTGTVMRSVVLLAVAQLHEQAVRLARVHPGQILARAVHLHAVAPQLLHRPGHVLALEPHQVDALAVLGQEASDGLVGIGRLHQLDVADAGRQDGVLEAELLGLAPLVDLQAEQLRVALHGGVQVTHHDRQLDHVTQHGGLLWRALGYIGYYLGTHAPEG